jgi:NADPH-dependent curcumin reductase CurA
LRAAPTNATTPSEELGFDACIDYKAHNRRHALAGKALKDACPNGIDGYFENVGGMVLDAVLLRMNAFGRIAVCGMIAGYDGAPLPMANPALILVNRLKVEGFIVSEHMEVWPEALTELGTAGGHRQAAPARERGPGPERLRPRPSLGLLKGKNFGKQLVKLI